MIREAILTQISTLNPYQIWGRVTSVKGTLLYISGLMGFAGIGQICVFSTELETFRGEIIAFHGDLAYVMAMSAPVGLKSGTKVYLESDDTIKPSNAWLGKVLNAYGQARKDGVFVNLPQGDKVYSLRGKPPVAANRRRLGNRMETGIGVFNTFLPICQGQRIGLFAGSGVGKSTLLAGLAKSVKADVVVIGLIGERGREVNEFIEETLGEDGLKRAVVVAATSDESPLLKRRAAYLAITTAEYFRDEGKQVLLLMDSLTRFAEAQREIGLAAGEPPAMRAFPTSSFSELMALCERSGPGTRESKQGDITAIFTVLVQGSDMEEPVADTVRGTLDGHIILDRVIAERNLYPAIDVLKSVSRSLPKCASDEENATLGGVKRILSDYNDIAPMVRLGAYKQGTSAELDRAIALYPHIENFIYTSQTKNTQESFNNLLNILKL